MYLFSPWVAALAFSKATFTCHAFQLYVPSLTSKSTSHTSSHLHCPAQVHRPAHCNVRRYAETGAEEAASASMTSNRRNKCGYLFEGRWEQRKDLADLKIGDKLLGRKLDGCDLLEAKTGPKIFFECGVGRVDLKGKWHIVNGMLRLGRRGARRSVTKKRVGRMTGKIVELYVSRIDTSAGRLEVTTSQEQAEEAAASGEKKIPASSLEVGDELVGTVVKVEDYGVFVDVGANRLGLMHIQRVADLFDRYIKESEGLAEAGLERGAKIRVAVVSNEKKRLFLDFTPDVKEDADAERKEQQRKREEEEEKKAKKAASKKVDEVKATAKVRAQQDEDDDSGISADEAAAWAAYGAGDDDAADWATFAAGDDDRYDEDDDIEDALGIGSYR